MHARYEPDAVAAQAVVKAFYERVALFRRQVSAVMVLYPAVGQGHYIAPHGQVVGAHLVADARRLKRPAAFIDFVEVVTEYGGVGHFASGMVAFGYGDEAACAPLACQHVHIWRVGVLQWGFPSKPFYRVVGHAVAEYYDVFHRFPGMFGVQKSDVGNAHYVGEHTGGRHACPCSVALYEHGVFLVAFGCQHDNVVRAFKVVEGVSLLDFL